MGKWKEKMLPFETCQKKIGSRKAEEKTKSGYHKKKVTRSLTASQLACNYSDSDAVSQKSSHSKTQHPGNNNIP